MADAAHVEFETPAGLAYGVSEMFPLDGGTVVPCLVIQPESGAAVTRVKFESPEADKLRKRYPELANVQVPTLDAAQQAQATNQAAGLSDEALAAELQRRHNAPASAIDQWAFPQNPTVAPGWTPGFSYRASNVVTFNGHAYRARVDSPNPTLDPTQNPAQWQVG